MALKLPDELKSQAPPTMWGKVLMTSPVIMAVLATMLAGLSSSEMTKAQYDRALAAQRQSKAGDQWNFFQAKRLRGATQRNTLDLLQTIAPIAPVSAEGLRQYAMQLPDKPKTDLLAAMDSADAKAALAAMERGEVPDLGPAPAIESNLKAALDALDAMKSEAEITPLVAQVDDGVLAKALHEATDRTQALDVATKPITQAIDRIDALLDAGRPVRAETAAMKRDFAAARMAFNAARYDNEARLNQVIANLHELEVRRANQSAERHHARSQRFFYGMLGAQLAVIISTFAIAARQRSLLWSLAAAAGLVATVFAVYVYLFI